MQKNLIKIATFLCTLFIGAATGMTTLAQAQNVPPVYSVRIKCQPSIATIAQGAWADFGCDIENLGNDVCLTPPNASPCRITSSMTRAPCCVSTIRASGCLHPLRRFAGT
jgi:hypothetical protein